ncbi:hypothetical protein [Solemya velum gill symbiont]|uniref:hypothetical protein n=1 Tax=Solemya velum gill symbiont TaxID=2340 RepID=UPI00117AD4C4|nr:hypothetical protein [Solemya velum gill symbiont]
MFQHRGFVDIGRLLFPVAGKTPLCVRNLTAGVIFRQLVSAVIDFRQGEVELASRPWRVVPLVIESGAVGFDVFSAVRQGQPGNRPLVTALKGKMVTLPLRRIETGKGDLDISLQYIALD